MEGVREEVENTDPLLLYALIQPLVERGDHVRIILKVRAGNTNKDYQGTPPAVTGQSDSDKNRI